MEHHIITGYQSVNGLQMYYEIHGEGSPLVLIHGGGSTIQTTFGKMLPLLAQHRQVIAVELQAHGHTADIDRPLTFEQDADDVATLLKLLNINNADFFGFSNGGSTALQIAIRHGELVRKLIIASALTKRYGVYSWFWEFMPNASLSNMPQALQEAYLNINPNQEGLLAMHNRDRDRMLAFTDWNDDDIKNIKASTLIISADQDVIRPEHILEMYRLLPQAKLAILPGVHGEYIGEVTTNPPDYLIEFTIRLILDFLV
jgi:pimeloyl-ACP methyl ester carboxylesterase